MYDGLTSQTMPGNLRREIAKELGFEIASVQVAVVKDSGTGTHFVRVGILPPTLFSDRDRRRCNDRVCSVLIRNGFKPALTSFVVFESLPVTA